MKRSCALTLFTWSCLLFSLAPCLTPHAPAYAAQLPSLFRGVVVADGALGARVVSVEDASQAFLADLRPEDAIVRINDTPVKNVDDFALASQALKGQAIRAAVRVLRNGQPRELVVHLYSYPILRRWELSFVPEHDIRFGDAGAGVAYWTRMGRGFETAGDVEHALNAYLNALHNDPTQVDVAVKACELLWRLAQARLKEPRLSDALMAIQEATVLLGKLFDQPLDEAQLHVLKSRLQETLQTFREFKST